MEVNSGLGVEKGSKTSDLKKKLKFEPIGNNLSNLRELGKKLKPILEELSEESMEIYWGC